MDRFIDCNLLVTQVYTFEAQDTLKLKHCFFFLIHRKNTRGGGGYPDPSDRTKEKKNCFLSLTHSYTFVIALTFTCFKFTLVLRSPCVAHLYFVLGTLDMFFYEE